MEKLIYVLILLVLTTVSQPCANAQTLPLSQLLKLGNLPDGLPLAKMTGAFFSADWTYRGHVQQTNETYWTATNKEYDKEPGNDAEADTETELATSWLSLRPMPAGTVDVLFKTRLAHNFEPIRRELKQRKLIGTPVTCRECEGERYEEFDYTITLYSGKKGPFPYIVVVHYNPVEMDAPAPRPVTIETPEFVIPASLPTAAKP